MNVRIIDGQSTNDIQSQIEILQMDGFKPTLCIVFANNVEYVSELLNHLSSVSLEVIGCSTAGSIFNDEIVEDSTILMLLDLPKSLFEIQNFSFSECENEFHASEKIAEHALQSFSNPGVIFFSSGLSRDGAQVVEGLKSKLRLNAGIFGGLAGDGTRFERTLSFTKNQIHEDGIVALILDEDKIQIDGRAVSGWEGLGRKNVMTKANGNILYEIDNKPALEVFNKFFNTNVGIETVPWEYPLEIINEKNGTTKLRSILQLNSEDNSLVLAGGVDEGDVFKFCNPPTFQEVDNSINNFQEFSKTVEDAEALIMVSCKARHTAFGPILQDEIKGIRSHWNLPMAGMLAYGEIGKSRNSVACDFHNATTSLITLKQIEN